MQSKRITISLDPDRFSALRSMSQRTGDTIAMVVRKAIDAIDTGGEERPDPAAPATSGPGGAVEAASGRMLFTFDGTSIPNGGGAQGAPVAYVAGGREYVANAFGGNLPDRAHFPPNAVGDAIVAFALPQQ